MGGRRYIWMIVLHMLAVFLLGTLSNTALADGFADKQVQIDGINSQGTLDDHNDLEFLGLGLWNGPIILRFSPSVRMHYSLGASVETETAEIMGKYAVKFSLTPKSGDTNNNNLKITVVDQRGSELDSEVMMTGETSEVAIEIATTEKPREFRISYSNSQEKSGSN